MKAGSETVVIQHPAPRDRFGDPEGEPIVLGTLTQCHVIPRMLDEDSDRGQVIIEGYQIITPPPSFAVPADAEVIVRGESQQVDGQVGDFRKKGRSVAFIFYTKGYGT